MECNASTTLSDLVCLCKEAGRRGADSQAVGGDAWVGAWMGWRFRCFKLIIHCGVQVTLYPGTLQEDLLTLKVRYDLRAGENVTGSRSLDLYTHFIE